MVEPRKRRIMKRAIWAVMIFVLLSSAYITSYGTVKWMLSGRIIDQGLAFKIDGSIVFKPLNWYESTELPGALALTTLSRWCIYRGQGSRMSLQQAIEGAKLQREMSRKNAELFMERQRTQKAASPTHVDDAAP